MLSPRHPALMVALLAAFMLRATLGAPCCWSGGSHAVMAEKAAPSHAMQQAYQDHAHHSHHADHAKANHAKPMFAMVHQAADDTPDAGGHTSHGDDPSANPCCSACGPTLPPDPIVFAASQASQTLPEPNPIRALATRPPFPAYDATGPPLTA